MTYERKVEYNIIQIINITIHVNINLIYTYKNYSCIETKKINLIWSCCTNFG